MDQCIDIFKRNMKFCEKTKDETRIAEIFVAEQGQDSLLSEIKSNRHKMTGIYFWHGYCWDLAVVAMPLV